MAHFAKVDNGVVSEVLFVSNDDCGGGTFPDSESIGNSLLNDQGLQGEWVQTSYNASFRYNYAGIGFTFDPAVGEHGAFIAPQPFPSWTLDDDMKWKPPVPYPTDGETYVWYEDAQEWQAVTV